MELEALKGWENFYVILGSAAGGLTGLTFVVIVLVREAGVVNPTGLEAYVTPTIVHFAGVLALAAFLCVPRLDAQTLEYGLHLLGIVGLAYAFRVAWKIGFKVGEYLADLGDWLWNVILPVIAYGAFMLMGTLLQRHPRIALDGVGAAAMLLLLIGIHNAWDIAVWFSFRARPEPPAEKPAGEGTNSPG